MELDNVTISGGFAYTVGPPTQATAGWWMGGSPSGEVIYRMIFATDTAAQSFRGSLFNKNVQWAGSSFTFDYGWLAGGLPTGTSGSVVQRLTFASDTSGMSVRGPLQNPRYSLSGTGNTDYGWFGGGRTIGGGYLPVSYINRITYASDSSLSSIRGPLSSARSALASTGTTTYGWFGGGAMAGYVITTTIDRVTYATDTAAAPSRGRLSSATYGLAACTDSSTYGWFGGGVDPGPAYAQKSSVQRITFATDTTTASMRGPLSAIAGRLASTASNTYGWFGGGWNGPAYLSTVNRIEYANDTTTASVRGPLASASYTLSGLSGIA